MRSQSRCAAAIAVMIVVVGTGCSSGTDSEAPTTPQATETSTTSQTPAPGAVEVSPEGVTTAIGAPADSTEEEYFKACQAARQWMAEQGGDPKSQIEPYLQTVQSGDAAGPGTFGTPWSQLPPARQAAVIVAVEAAAEALCG